MLWDDPQIRASLLVFIGTANTLGLLVIGYFQRKNGKNTRAIRYQVENNHIDEQGNPINLREEFDDRHEHNKNQLTALVNGQSMIINSLHDVRQDVNLIKERQFEQDKAIDVIQDTQTKQQIADAVERAKHE